MVSRTIAQHVPIPGGADELDRRPHQVSRVLLCAGRAVEVQRVVDLEEKLGLLVAGGGSQRTERTVDEVLDGEHDVAGRGLHREVADFGDHALATTGQQLLEFPLVAPRPLVQPEAGEGAGVSGVGKFDVPVGLGLLAQGVLPPHQAGSLRVAGRHDLVEEGQGVEGA